MMLLNTRGTGVVNRAMKATRNTLACTKRAPLMNVLLPWQHTCLAWLQSLSCLSFGAATPVARHRSTCMDHGCSSHRETCAPAFRVGKVPPEMLETQVLCRLGAPALPSSLLVPPAMGEDAAVIALSPNSRGKGFSGVAGHKKARLAVTSDPITTGEETDLGRLLVHVNANDIAAAGGKPEWLVLTVLLPEGSSPRLLKSIMEDVHTTASAMGICVIGGHTEVTKVVNAPVCVGTMLGELITDHVVTTSGAKLGDRIILTKGAAIEGTAILCGDAMRREKLVAKAPHLFSSEELLKAHQKYSQMLSVVEDARVAADTAGSSLSSMHDPTEGGVANALHEMCEASSKGFRVNRRDIPVSLVTQKLCSLVCVDPLHMISSGALLATVEPTKAAAVISQLHACGIEAADIGVVVEKPLGYMIDERKEESATADWRPLVRPPQDALWDVLDTI